MTERLVLDASVISKVYLKDENYSDLAVDIVRRFVLGGLELVAPQYILYEVPSSILNAVRRRRLAPGEALLAVQEFFRIELPTVGEDRTIPGLIQQAYSLAHEYGCRLYDGLYVAVAQEFDFPLVTADARLYRGLFRKVPQLTWIGDYRLPSP